MANRGERNLGENMVIKNKGVRLYLELSLPLPTVGWHQRN